MVQEDVIEGYVSAKRAKSDYGVVVKQKTFEIDRDATMRLRKGSGRVQRSSGQVAE
jgi:N-methylhydantoinase B/oxoprolinase/acetone carboxylase alpha subunit